MNRHIIFSTMGLVIIASLIVLWQAGPVEDSMLSPNPQELNEATSSKGTYSTFASRGEGQRGSSLDLSLEPKEALDIVTQENPLLSVPLTVEESEKETKSGEEEAPTTSLGIDFSQDGTPMVELIIAEKSSVAKAADARERIPSARNEELLEDRTQQFTANPKIPFGGE